MPLLRRHGVVIKYPDGWHKQEMSDGAIAAFTTDPDNQYAPTINIVKQDLSHSPMTLRQFTEQSLMQMQMLLNDLGGLDVKDDIALGGHPAKEVAYTTPLPNTTKTLQFVQRFTVVESVVAYIVTFCSSVDEFKRYERPVRDAFESFQIADPSARSYLVLSTYTDRQRRFRIRYPQMWSKHSNANNCAVYFEHRNDRARKNFKIVVDVRPLPPNVDDGKYTEIVKLELATAGVVVEQVHPLILSNYPANWTAYRNPASSDPGSYLQAWTVRDGTAYVITVMGNGREEDKETVEEEISNLFSAVLRSFRFSPDLEASLYRYEHLLHKFSLLYPENYKVREAWMGATVLFEKESEIAPQNMTVVYQDQHKNEVTTLEDVCDKLKTELDNTITNCQMLSKEDAIVDTAVGKQLIYSGEVDQRPVKFVQRVAMLKTQLVVLGFVCPHSEFDTEFRRVSKLMDSFGLFVNEDYFPKKKH